MLCHRPGPCFFWLLRCKTYFNGDALPVDSSVIYPEVADVVGVPGKVTKLVPPARLLKQLLKIKFLFCLHKRS